MTLPLIATPAATQERADTPPDDGPAGRDPHPAGRGPRRHRPGRPAGCSSDTATRSLGPTAWPRRCALAESEPFDLVVSDLGLPDGDGYELMQQLRQRHGLSGIALSGFGMEGDVLRGREAGFLEHLVKPVNVATLDQTIRRVIHMIRSQPHASTDGPA